MTALRDKYTVEIVDPTALPRQEIPEQPIPTPDAPVPDAPAPAEGTQN
jgi:hypothetical protein